MYILIPPEGKLIVKEIQEENVRPSGIVVGIRSGEEILNPHDTLKATVVYSAETSRIKPGRLIYFERRFSLKCEIEGESYLVIMEKDILGMYSSIKPKRKAE